MWLDLQIFGFRALWSPYFLTFVIGIAIIYFLLTGPLRHKFGEVDKPTRNMQLFFYTGLILLYTVKGSPVDLLSHIMMSAHMIQMALLYFVFPIFVIRGIPAWMWSSALKIKFVNVLFKSFGNPLVALMLFNSLFTMYHIPAIFDFSKSSQTAHLLITIILLFTAFFMWWPIVTPVKKYDTMFPLVKMGYLLISILFISIACALIIFSNAPLFNAYSSEGAWIQALSLCVPGDVLSGIVGDLSGAEMFSPLSTLDDQQLGGIIMMFLQQIIYGFVIAWVFFSWFSKKNLQIDPLPSTVPLSK